MLLILVWTFPALFVFYKNFPIGLDYIAGLLPGVFLLAMMVFSAVSSGNSILNAIGFRENKFTARLTAAFAMGMVLLGVSYTVLAFFHLVYPLSASLLILLLALAGLPGLRTLCGSFSMKKDYPRRELILTVPLLFLFLTLPLVLAPVVSFDAMVYHLSVPKQIIAHHGFFANPHNSHAAFPFYIQMIYTLALSLGSGTTAKMINFTFSVFLLAAAVSFAGKYAPRTETRLGALIFFTMPVTMIAGGWALVDIPLTFYILLACLLLYRFHRDGSYPSLLAASVFAGFAAGIKYSALLFLAALLPGWILLEGKSFFGRKNLKALLIFAVIAAVIGSPWYIKNLTAYGNPVHPLGSSEGDSLLFYKGDSFGLKNSLARIFDYAVGTNYIDEVIGFLPLVLFPFIIFVKRDRFINYIAVTAAASLLMTGVLFAPSARILLPGLILLSLASGTAAVRLWRAHLFFRIIVFILVSLSLLFSLPVFYYTADAFDPLPVVLGLESREAYLSETLGIYPVIEYANKNLDHPRVLFLWCHSTYYADFDYISSAPVDPTPVSGMAGRAENGPELLEMLFSNGFTHIIMDLEELNKRPPDGPGMEKLLYVLNAARPLIKNKNIILLELQNYGERTVASPGIAYPKQRVMDE